MTAALEALQRSKGKAAGEVEDAVKKVLCELQGPADGKDELGRALTAMADASSRHWLMCIGLLETKALVGQQSDWARAVPFKDQQSPAVQKWMKSPSLDQLAKATASSLESNFYWGGNHISNGKKFGEQVDSDASRDVDAGKKK
eukprot:5626739-Amphidinium_carterae.1